MVAILIFFLHLQLFRRLLSVIAPDRLWPALLLPPSIQAREKISLIQLASLQKIVVPLADHLLFGILGNQQSARIQLGTAFFHQA